MQTELIPGADYSMPAPKSPSGQAQDLFLRKMSPEFLVARKAGILLRWLESYVGARFLYLPTAGEIPVLLWDPKDSQNGLVWMRNFTNSHSAESVCSLSEILETGPIDRRYFLTPRACLGILRRAEKRGKDLPPQLARALMAVAASAPTSTATGGQSLARSLRAQPNSSHREDSQTFVAFGGNKTTKGGIKDTATACNAKGGSGRMDYETETLLVADTINSPGSGDRTTQVDSLNYVPVNTHTLKADGHDASEDGTGRGVPLVAVTLNSNKRAAGSATSQDAHSGQLIAFSAKDRGTDAGNEPPLCAEGQPHVASGYMVRRLTVLECERLMGTPDNYTAIPYRGKIAADGPRYRSLGNSFCPPVIQWIGKRIEQLDRLTRPARKRK